MTIAFIQVTPYLHAVVLFPFSLGWGSLFLILADGCMSLVRSEISITLLDHLSTLFTLTKIIILRDSQHS
jgi:hypothetical protein